MVTFIMINDIKRQNHEYVNERKGQRPIFKKKTYLNTTTNSNEYDMHFGLSCLIFLSKLPICC